jgi:hypothetical protein
MADKVVVCVGTKRGLFLFESSPKRRDWKMRGPFLDGWQIYHAVIDVRGTPTIHAAAVSNVLAATTARAKLKDGKFTAAKKPPVPPKPTEAIEKAYREWGIAKDPRVWHVEPGRKNEKGVLYAGTAPAGLFRTEDGGDTWEPVNGLNEHPTKEKWMPGAGGNCVHTIQLDPLNDRRMYVAISAAGGFRTDDDGETWQPINRGVAKYPGAPKDTDVGS